VPRRGATRAAAALPVPPRLAEPDARWDLLLLCLAGYLLASVGRVHQLFPLLGLVRPAILTGAIALGIYLFGTRVRGRAADLRWPATKAVLALLGWMVLSVPGSLSPGTSLDTITGDFAKTVAMLLVVIGAVRGLRDVQRLAAVYLAAAATYAAVVIARFDLGGGESWRLGDLYYYDANDFATFAVSAMPLAVYFVHAARRRRSRVLAAAALTTLALGLVWSGSRGGFLALIAVAAFVLLRYHAIPVRWRIGATAVVAVVVMATASDRYWKQMGTIVEDADYNRTDESGRLQIWQRGIGYMLQYPLLGVGANNFGAAEGLLSPFAYRQQFGVGVRWNAAHNSFVQVGAELGVPGLVFLVAVIASALAALRAVGRRAAEGDAAAADGAPLAQALTASLAGFVVGAFFLSLAYSAMLYTLVALAVALRKVSAPPRAARRSEVPWLQRRPCAPPPRSTTAACVPWASPRSTGG
jgi:O-antigen ligase